MKCPTCDRDNLEEAQFCGICGTALISDEVPSGTELPMMSFSQAIILGFSNYFNFCGRATRAETWWFVLFIVLGRIGLGIISGFVGLPGLLDGVFGIGILIPGLALGARRLHDINKTGWWLLLWLVPMFGWIVMIVWAIKQGDNGPNKYGPDPRQAT